MALFENEAPPHDVPHDVKVRLTDRDVLWLVHGQLSGIGTQMLRQNTLLRLSVLLLGLIAAGRVAADFLPALG